MGYTIGAAIPLFLRYHHHRHRHSIRPCRKPHGVEKKKKWQSIEAYRPLPFRPGKKKVEYYISGPMWPPRRRRNAASTSSFFHFAVLFFFSLKEEQPGSRSTEETGMNVVTPKIALVPWTLDKFRSARLKTPSDAAWALSALHGNGR